MKYKVGDKVKIREDLIVGNNYGGLSLMTNMALYMGKICVIGGITSQGNYCIDVWNFSEEMIEGLAEQKVKKEENNMKDFKIVDYKTYEDRVVIVKFDDNTEEKAVCCDTDKFDLECGVQVCVLKHMLGENEYKSMLRKAMKQIKAVDKAKNEKKKNDEAAARRKAKNAKRKARHKENRRNRRIAEMKEAYLAAMREHGSVDCEEVVNVVNEVR